MDNIEHYLRSEFWWFHVYIFTWFWAFFSQVTYQTELFLDKNKDYVVAEHQALLSASKCSFVSSLFLPLAEESSKTSKFSSIGSRFKVDRFSFLKEFDHILHKPAEYDSPFVITAATIATIAWNPQFLWATLHSVCKAQ